MHKYEPIKSMSKTVNYFFNRREILKTVTTLVIKKLKIIGTTDEKYMKDKQVKYWFPCSSQIEDKIINLREKNKLDSLFARKEEMDFKVLVEILFNILEIKT